MLLDHSIAPQARKDLIKRCVVCTLRLAGSSNFVLQPVDTVPPAHPRASKSSISSLLCTSPYSTPSSQTPRTVDSTSEDSHSDEDYGPPLYDTFAKVDLERARIVFNPASTQDLIVSTMRLNKDLRTKDLHNEWERDNPWTIDPVCAFTSLQVLITKLGFPVGNGRRKCRETCA
jgi:hypothetical protein